MQGEETLPELSEKTGYRPAGGCADPDQRRQHLRCRRRGLCQIRLRLWRGTGRRHADHFDGAAGLRHLRHAADGWCIYANLSEDRGSSQALAEAIRTAVEPSMAQRAWNGEDITMSAVALTQAVYDMAQAAEDYTSRTARRTAPSRKHPRRRQCRRHLKCPSPTASVCSMYLTSATFSPMRSGRNWRLAPQTFPTASIAASISPWWMTSRTMETAAYMRLPISSITAVSLA